MSNIWRAEGTEYPEDDIRFLARDFDPMDLWSEFGGDYFSGPIHVYDETNNDEHILTIDKRDGKPWVQPYENGEPVAFRWA